MKIFSTILIVGILIVVTWFVVDSIMSIVKKLKDKHNKKNTKSTDVEPVEKDKNE